MHRNFLRVFFLLFPVWTEGAIPSCPRAWNFYGGYCFRTIFGNNQYNYNRANIACENAGGRLASIHSSEELEFLQAILYPSGLFYIGLKRNEEGNWMYNDTSSYDYDNWEIQEPAVNDDCVVLDPTTFKWSGESCYLNVDGALCRKPLVDYDPPNGTCTNTTVQVPESVESTSVNFVEPVILDESSPVTITRRSHQRGDIFQKGETRINYTFQDPFSNEGSCSFFVIVKEADKIPPTVTCSDFNVTIPLESSGTNVYFDRPNAVDNSGHVTIVSQSHQPGDFFVAGNTTVTYNFSDADGNSEGCSFMVTVARVDMTPPSVACDNFTDTMPLESPAGGKNVSFEEPKATDNSGQVFLLSRSHRPSDFFEEGETKVTYTFVDAAGNNESCSFYVIVQRADMTPPSVECKNFTEKISNDDQEKRVYYMEPTALDNSGQDVTILSQSHHPGDFFPLGDTSVRYSFSDASGNNESCSFTVTVRKDDQEEISPELDRILQHFQGNNRNFSHTNVTEFSEELAEFTSSRTELNEKEVDVIADALSDVSSANSTSPNVTLFVLKVTDNIITAEEGGNDVISSNSSEVILRSLERQLENVRDGGQNFTQTGQNIAVNVVQVNNFAAPIIFGSFSALHEEANGTEGLGSTSLLSDSPEPIDEKVVSIQLDPKALLEAFPEGQETLPLSFVVHRTDALFQNSKRENSNLKINSLIIAASTSMPIRNLPPESLVVTSFLPKNKSLMGDTQCMFWNHTLHGSLGGWSGEGCYLEEDETSEVFSCFCNHLTSFAILVSPSGDVDHEFVSIVTLIGCVISIVCLSVTIVSLIASRNIRSKTPQKIIIHLSCALLGLYIFFLIGVERTDLPIGCVIFGGLIHFFCLASIAWMSVEAANMYLMFVKVINANIRNFLWKSSVFAWGLPLAIVLASTIASPSSYLKGENCFPHHTSLVFYISVFSLVVLLLVGNLFIFIVVVWKLTCSRKNIASSSNARRDTLRRLQNIFAISVLLGATWTFGLFPIKDRTLQLIFSILFCLFNSLQGCFIFLLFGLRQKEVRKTWKRWLCIDERGGDSTKSTGLSSQSDQRQLGNMKGRKKPESDASANTDIPRCNVETKGV